MMFLFIVFYLLQMFLSNTNNSLGKRSITISSSSISSTTNTSTPSMSEKGKSSSSKNDPRLGKRPLTISSSSSSSTTNRAKPTSTPAEKGSSSNSRDDSHLGKRSITISSSSSSTTRRAKPTSTSSMAEKGSSSSNSKDESRFVCELCVERSITISSPSSSTTRREKPTSRTSSMAEKGPSSSNSRDKSRFVCELCVESRRSEKLFSVKGCSHAYCADCIAKYVTSKVEQNITSIGCPVSACRGKLDPEYCCKILPEHVFDRWGKALSETVIVGAQKFYCPFKDCSALLINDAEEEETIRESECPYCHRLFCAHCRVPWHSEIDCADFQKLNKNEREREDIMLMKLAQNKKWQRCPNCRYYVEKKEGCLFMYCRSVLYFYILFIIVVNFMIPCVCLFELLVN
ncbi:hypothetical protein Ddye_020310 [Dipteronia dyeriana]|uniref:RBR-type E3 ubiquitin transferase n=1 Tax=Dipteronia dyeriana TaxID=168575 RepID=A0AAD9U0K1_9ROSI|nr:hypothetical protein Ddye_020310 [Dipteronia dyeriana]